MKLYVRILRARDLRSAGEARARAKLGRHKSSTLAVAVAVAAEVVWDEEFVFRARDVEEKLSVSVFVGRGGGVLVGSVRVPVWMVLGEEGRLLPPTWFSLHPKGRSSHNTDAGKILIAISLGKRFKANIGGHHSSYLVEGTSIGVLEKALNKSDSLQDVTAQDGTNLEKPKRPSVKVIAGRFVQKLLSKKDATDCSNEESTSSDDDSSYSNSITEDDGSNHEPSQSIDFKEALQVMKLNGEEIEMPGNFGGILLEECYLTSPESLNALLFAAEPKFLLDLAERQGTTELHVGEWTCSSKEVPSLKRDLTYIKAATKLCKAVKAFEEQLYLKADGSHFAILSSVTTPDVPYGSCFKVELLYRITSGPDLPSSEETSCLVISWNVKFIQQTFMRGMIEAGVQQGLKENYEQFAELLAQSVQTVNSSLKSSKDRVLASVESERPSNLKLAVHYFWNVSVVSTVLMLLYVLVHIFLSGTRQIQGIEFIGLDLPDSFGELVTGAMLVMQIGRAINMISCFVDARSHRGSDRDAKSHGEGWILTVALIEGENLAANDLDAHPNPYVVFSSHGKTTSSSVKLNASNPQWNEILDFNTMDDPPSVMNVEVFNFDGSFDESDSLGSAEINFLKQTAEELSDIWLPLRGKLAQVSLSRVHLRVFLDNKGGDGSVKGYISKMEKEIGKKINPRSPHRNMTFQRIFGLPPEELLINDFSCYLKRKLPLQGRLFLSTRIIGFYSKIFWSKTKFFFLWEDVEDIQVSPPSLSSMGPSLFIFLKQGHGQDARHGAKSLDEDGHLVFQFQSFASFGLASRAIMALWRTKCSEKGSLSTGSDQYDAVTRGDEESSLEDELLTGDLLTGEL